MKNKKCTKLWLYFGLVSGFLSGFLYFAYGVYTHGQGRGAGPYERSTEMQPGATFSGNF